jgi:hypothetical protein
MTMAKATLLDKLKKNSKTITVGGDKLYIVEGDMVLDEEQLRVYALQREAMTQVQAAGREAREAGFGLLGIVEAPRDELIGIMHGGKIVRWEPGVVLSYCVLKETFPNTEDYDMVVANMQKATSDWEKTCGVKFEYKKDMDTSESLKPAGVLFTVREIDAGGEFIAAAFFPNDPKDRRVMLIDPSYYDPGLLFDKVGVLRHELGHVLGFRHEHIRSGAPPDCPDEDTKDTFEFTKYDPRSVMHYFCGNLGSKELAISEQDKIGARKLYGLPLDSFRFIKG